MNSLEIAKLAHLIKSINTNSETKTSGFKLGIRKEAAQRLNMKYNRLFHKRFDEAVNLLRRAAIFESIEKAAVVKTNAGVLKDANQNN